VLAGAGAAPEEIAMTAAAPTRTASHRHMRPVVRPVPRPLAGADSRFTW
jgi:hypothetical protein